MEATKYRSHHFVLVHGACHGAWSWYKLKPLLESEGHRVTVLDLAGSGTSTKTIYDVRSFTEYNEPLMQRMAVLEADEKVILVGHSLGGLSLALAVDRFPEKVYVAVFLAAFLPDTVHLPSYVLDQYFALAPKEAWLDTEFTPYGEVTGKQEKILTSMFFGPKFLSLKLYQLSSREDLELAKILARPSSLFREDLCETEKYSVHGFGACKKAYIVCKEDQAIGEAYQRWMIENTGVEYVVEIPGADHMAMLSKVQQLSECLLQIAATYAQ
ncbi:hypothetical protein MLD38_004617 [Melastoma candidum]|uniref:Uncharacterized protein n=1 Tax=Melastoma candidum TaxID=119954 RepID=A0ACB9S7S2_9MYRT|nr:hypothetical protein MLD38_004617 [Melastoma candidum]